MTTWCMSASEPVPDEEERDTEEAEPEDKLTLEIWKKGSESSRLPLTSFMTRALPWYGQGKDWHHIETLSEKWRGKRVGQKSWYVSLKPHRVCLPALPPLPPPPPLAPLPPLRQRDQPLLLRSLLSGKTRRVRTFLMIHFHLLVNTPHALWLINVCYVYVSVSVWKCNHWAAGTEWHLFASSSSCETCMAVKIPSLHRQEASGI